ncbi:hypothetical protein L950_0216100 [Sphingobacterium sp. IITKGP-BTPF85]|nr:hypothetical protein L950_0216100 [Sphingobacterium sp. IITKGP-BTPF85]
MKKSFPLQLIFFKQNDIHRRNICSFFLKLVGINEPIIIVAGFLIFGCMIIIIVIPPVERMIKNPLFEKDFKKLNKSQIYRKRALALFLYIASLYLMIISLIFLREVG